MIWDDKKDYEIKISETCRDYVLIYILITVILFLQINK